MRCLGLIVLCQRGTFDYRCMYFFESKLTTQTVMLVVPTLDTHILPSLITTREEKVRLAVEVEKRKENEEKRGRRKRSMSQPHVVHYVVGLLKNISTLSHDAPY